MKPEDETLRVKNPKPKPYTSGSYASRIMGILKERGISKTACPSEVLPAHLKKSPSTMAKVRQVAEKLQSEGKLLILRSGKPVRKGSKGPTRLKLRTSDQGFDYTLDFKQIDFRKRPELYRIGKGEQGVLLVEPYKSEILPFWRFKTPDISLQSAKKIYALFLGYGRTRDFIGMDMARKFLQMGVTRSRRCANHKSGQKYVGAVPFSKRGQSGAHGRQVAALMPDLEKAKSAEIFGQFLEKAKKNKIYGKWLIDSK